MKKSSESQGGTQICDEVTDGNDVTLGPQPTTGKIRCDQVDQERPLQKDQNNWKRRYMACILSKKCVVFIQADVRKIFCL